MVHSSTPESDMIDLSLMAEVFNRHASERGALIPVLQEAQAIYGYLPKEVLALIARRLGVSIGQVYGVATFYAQFYLERRGRHVLKICDGTACHVKGTPVLLTAIEDAYELQPGQTSPDGELTVELVYCLGSCALAPVTVLDGEVMGRMRQATMLATLSNKIVVGENA